MVKVLPHDRREVNETLHVIQDQARMGRVALFFEWRFSENQSSNSCHISFWGCFRGCHLSDLDEKYK